MSESKACNSCKQVKNLELFKKEKKSNSGYGSICARCHANNVAAYRKNNPDKVKASWKKTYDKNRPKRIANSQKWSANNPEQRKKLRQNIELKIELQYKLEAKPGDY